MKRVHHRTVLECLVLTSLACCNIADMVVGVGLESQFSDSDSRDRLLICHRCTVVSQLHEDYHCMARIKFFYLIVIGEVKADDVTPLPPDTASVPFVFSPPARRTRGKSSNAVAKTDNGHRSDAAVQRTHAAEPVVKKSKRLANMGFSYKTCRPDESEIKQNIWIT